MSVLFRIRLVGAIATSVVVTFGVVVFLWVAASVDSLPEILLLGAAGALLGMLVLSVTSIGVALARSVKPSELRQALDAEATQPLRPQTSYQPPNA